VRKTSYIYIALILICGFVLSLNAYVKMDDYESDKADEVLSVEARRIVQELQDFLITKYSTLRYMKAYFYAYESLGLDEFELFSTAILLFEPDIDSLLFVLEVSPELYPQYRMLHESMYGDSAALTDVNDAENIYPVHFVKSFNDARLGHGMNVTDNAEIKAALAAVHKNAEPKMVFLDTQGGIERELYIIDPLFTIDKQSMEITNRIDFENYYAQHGFIFLGLDLNEFIESYTSRFSATLCIDLGYKEDGQYSALYAGGECQSANEANAFDVNFEFFGTDWSMTFIPRHIENGEYSWQKYLILYGGVLFTILIACYFYMIFWQRTQDRLAQRKLNQEIAKKEQLNLQMQDYTDKLELARLQQMDIYRSLQEEKLRAEQANKTKSDFLANMSHELRTPLNSILGIAKMVKEEYTDSAEALEMLEILESSSMALLEIVNDILDLSKIEAGKVQLERIDFDVRDIVKNVSGSLKTVADRKGLYLKNKFKKDDFPVLKGDPLRLSRILMNLIGNAVKYSVEGGVTVVVDYEVISDGRALLQCSVSDTGIGINKDKLPFVFDKFTQADETTTRTFGGTGLGLTITQDLLGMMGGDITVESVEGLGSTFSFVLPLDISDNKEQMKTLSSKVVTEVDDVSKKQIEDAHVLVVEDNEFNVLLIRKFLKKIGFQHVAYANDGVGGVECVREAAFDLILMDCHMPIKSGYEATEEIRKLEIARGQEYHVPIIALTADAMVGVKERCLEAGMNDYLSKPVDYNDLAEVMLRWLKKRIQRRSS
jgi:signal transduction histidine kinase/CheY-like chemotaxis protein